MTLDEAIEHARDKANEQKYYTSFEKNTLLSCKKCAEEHEQLAEWLEELKKLREFKAIYQKGMDYSYATFIYNKAIDDLTKKIAGYGTYDYYGNVINVLEIAEELKRSVQNDSKRFS